MQNLTISNNVLSIISGISKARSRSLRLEHLVMISLLILLSWFIGPLLPSVFFSSLLSLKNQIVNVEIPSIEIHVFSSISNLCFSNLSVRLVFLQQIYRKNTKGFREITNTRQENNHKENSAVQMKMNKSKINKKVGSNLAVVTKLILSDS